VILSAGLLKVKFNVVMSILPCLILFYSTSVSIHILNHQGDLKKVIQPTLIAVLTTCAGFAVFMFDRSPLLRDFGLLAVIGLAAGLIWAVIFYYPVRSDKIIILPIRQKLNHVKRYWNKWVLISSIILTGLCIPGILRIRAEIDVRSSLPPTNKAIQDYRFVEGRLGPYMPVEYLVDIKGTDMESLKRWTDEVYGFEEVGAVMSFQAIPAMIYPGTGFISRDGSKGRIVFYVPVLSTTEGLMLVKRMNELAEKDFPPSSPLPQPTGHISLYVSVAEHLASSFRRSLILAFFLVFIIIGVYLRNLRLFLVSIIPNILPVAAILGIMGWLRIPLDMVTMPMGCMALGIIVDDTVHILYWYRKTTDTDLAFENAGPGTILTSLIYIMGFCVFLTSGIYPVRYFGILLITAMATAFVGDIMLLPYLLKSQVQKRISSQTRSNHEI
jgi:predicted RND superfamily exporter protein